MFKIGIVGAGPAGSSAALRLLKSTGVKFEVNLFDRALTPWGLLRTGVAPDHPEVKNTTQAWKSISTYKYELNINSQTPKNNLGPFNLARSNFMAELILGQIREFWEI